MEIERIIKWNGLIFRPKISTYYMEQKHRYDLYNAVERKLLPMMDDPAMAMQELYELLILDHGVSEQKKTEMIEGFPFDTLEEIAEFLTQLLCFAMVRCPDGRMSIRSMLRELTVWDRILGGRVPPLCQWFQGREEELEELHELLQREGKVFLHGIPGIGKSELEKPMRDDMEGSTEMCCTCCIKALCGRQSRYSSFLMT